GGLFVPNVSEQPRGALIEQPQKFSALGSNEPEGVWMGLVPAGRWVAQQRSFRIRGAEKNDARGVVQDRERQGNLTGLFRADPFGNDEMLLFPQRLPGRIERAPGSSAPMPSNTRSNRG